MHFTRRLPDRSSAALLVRPALALALALPLSMTVGCADDARPSDVVPDRHDAGVPVTPPPAEDAGAPPPDAAPPPGPPPKPLEVTCEAEPCAVKLTTTLPGLSGRHEGYCALLGDGTVACWGGNDGGQLATGPDDKDDRTAPIRIAGISGVTSLHHTCTVDGAGTVRCWGTGAFARTTASPGYTVETTPVTVPLDGPADDVALSLTTACALLRSGDVHCWGANTYKVVGADAPTPAPPTKIQGLPSGIRKIDIGVAAFALLDDGRLFSWGRAPGVGRTTSFGGDPVPRPVTLEGVSAIDVVDGEACVVAEGAGWCWGESVPQGGNIADPNARALPRRVDVPAPITRIGTSRTYTVQQGGVSVVEQRRFCATDGEGDVYCWGLNNVGQAGNGGSEYVTQTTKVQNLPAPAADVKVLPYSTCALLTNGKVFCWGSNLEGQLGAGLPRGSFAVPVEVKLP